MIVITTLIVGGLLGFLMGWVVKRREGEALTHPAERELNYLRGLVDILYDEAADHIALGDSTLAPIVFDEIRKVRKELM